MNKRNLLLIVYLTAIYLVTLGFQNKIFGGDKSSVITAYYWNDGWVEFASWDGSYLPTDLRINFYAYNSEDEYPAFQADFDNVYAFGDLSIAEGLVDDFNDGQIDPKWTLSSDPYTNIYETDVLNIDVPSGLPSQGHNNVGHLRTDLVIHGDFDLQIDFTLSSNFHSFPSGQANIQLLVDGASDLYAVFKIISGYYSAGEGRHAGYWVEHGIMQTSDLTGKLRITREEDITPPEITVTLSPNNLWPPNHKMIDIIASVTVKDNIDPDPDWKLVSIESNEPEEGPGNKNFPYIMGADYGSPDTEFQLRAERFGTGEDRVYAITYMATDASSNSTVVTDTVIVPHNMGKIRSFESDTPMPDSYYLYTNYPNPFNPTTKICFTLPEANHVVLKIYNSLGQEILTITDGIYEAGYHSVIWDGKDNNGNLVSNGVYLYLIKAGTFMQTRKMLLLK